MSITNNPDIVGSAREAGAATVHTVSVKGEVVATRRSAHRYPYAIAYWSRRNGEVTLIVKRWSRSPKASGGSFAIRIDN